MVSWIYSLSIVIGIIHLDVVNPFNTLEDGVSGVPRLDIAYVDVRKPFTTEQEFMLRDHVLKWVCLEAGKLDYGYSSGGLVMVLTTNLHYCIEIWKKWWV